MLGPTLLCANPSPAQLTRPPAWPRRCHAIQVLPAGTLALPHDDLVLAAREVEKLERLRSALRSERHGRLREELAKLNSLFVNPRLQLSLS